MEPVDYEAAARFGRFNYEIAREVADASERARWNLGDEFERASLSPRPQLTSAAKCI